MGGEGEEGDVRGDLGGDCVDGAVVVVGGKRGVYV